MVLCYGIFGIFYIGVAIFGCRMIFEMNVWFKEGDSKIKFEKV